MVIDTIVAYRAPVYRASQNNGPAPSTIDWVIDGSTRYLAAWTPDGHQVGRSENDAYEGRRMWQRFFREYMPKDGEKLEQFVGRSRRPDFVGSESGLPDPAIAANVRATNGWHGIVSNGEYSNRIAEEAAQHGVTWDLASRHILAHEHLHMLAPRGYRSEIGEERWVEATLLNYYTKRSMETTGAERTQYQELAKVARNRLAWYKKMSSREYQQMLQKGAYKSGTCGCCGKPPAKANAQKTSKKKAQARAA